MFTAPGTGTWHKPALIFQDSAITATIDGTAVGTVTDTNNGRQPAVEAGQALVTS